MLQVWKYVKLLRVAVQMEESRHYVLQVACTIKLVAAAYKVSTIRVRRAVGYSVLMLGVHQIESTPRLDYMPFNPNCIILT